MTIASEVALDRAEQSGLREVLQVAADTCHTTVERMLATPYAKACIRARHLFIATAHTRDVAKATIVRILSCRSQCIYHALNNVKRSEVLEIERVVKSYAAKPESRPASPRRFSLFGSRASVMRTLSGVLPDMASVGAHVRITVEVLEPDVDESCVRAPQPVRAA